MSAPEPVEPPRAPRPLDRVLSRLHPLVERLRVAGHDAVVDDRTLHAEPSIRFQVRPRRGPLDDADRPLPALELVVDPGTDQFVARVWSHAEDRAPASEVRLPEAPTTGHIDRLLLDFVADALARA